MRRNLLNRILIIRLLVDADGVALAVEGEDLAVGFIVKRFLRKILVRAILDVDPDEFLDDRLLFVVVDEVAMYLLPPPKKVEVDLVII